MSNKLKIQLEREALIVAQANYILVNKGTVRTTAKAFGISKTATHNMLHKELKDIDGVLYEQVDELFKQNYEERNIRGGRALQKKVCIPKIK